MKKKIRDTGRKRLYAAEDSSRLLRWGKEFKDIESCQRYIDNILRSKWFKKKYPKIKKISVCQSRGFGGQAEAGGIIRIGRDSMLSHYLLHELAHHSVTIKIGHGWVFAESMLKFVRRFLGMEAYIELRKNFIKYGVKYFDPQGKHEKR